MANNPPSYQSYTLPPPVGGLNYADPIDNMPQGDARIMQNVFPDNESAKLRSGCTLFGTVSGGNPIERLWNLVLADGTEKLVAAVNNTLQDVTTGTPSAITGTTTPTSDLWQSLVFRNRLFIVNGTNAPQVWTGSSNFADAGFTGSGLTPADVINIGAYRGRVYLVEKNTASVWYGGTAGVTGATTELDLSSVLHRGGFLRAVGSFTNPNGDTAQDLWLAVSSEGEVLLYTGSDPGDSAWAIVARYYIAKPIGYRCLIEYDSDVLILTRAGLIAVSSLFRGDETGQTGIGRKVNKYIRQAAVQRGDLDGWHGTYSADQRKLFLNMPISATSTEQLVCNVDTGAWCSYVYNSEQPYSWSRLGSKVYFGGQIGGIYEAESGVTDNGQGIVVDLLWAWNYFGSRGNYKRFTDARPLTVGSRLDSLGIQMETDYKLKSLPAKTIMGASTTPWGSPWGSPWGGGSVTNFARYGLNSQGHSGALRLFGTFKNVKLELNATEVRFETGGQI